MSERGEDGEGSERGLGKRQKDTPVNAEWTASVELGRINQFLWDTQEELPEQKRAKGVAREGTINDKCEFTQPSSLTIKKIGIMMTWTGSSTKPNRARITCHGLESVSAQKQKPDIELVNKLTDDD